MRVSDFMKFGKKYTEFRQDSRIPDLAQKLYLTPQQQKRYLKWILLSALPLLMLILQDVLFSRMSLYGGTVDMVPCVLLMICVILGAAEGSVFMLVGALIYWLAGSAPGVYVIFLIPLFGTLSAAFRQAYLRKGVFTNIACAAIAFFIYEMFLLGIGILSEQTVWQRAGTFLVTTGLTLLSTPVLYPLLSRLERIGGETWND